MRRAGQLIRLVSLWPIRAPRLALGAAALLAMLSALCVLRLKPDTSLESMFSRDDPAAAALLRVMHDFSSAEELLILATAPDESPQVLEQYARRLEQSLQGSPIVQRIIWR